MKFIGNFIRRALGLDPMENLLHDVTEAARELALEWDQYLLLEEEVGFFHQQLIELQADDERRPGEGNVTLTNLLVKLNRAVTNLMGEVASLSAEYSDYLSKKFKYQRAGGSILTDHLAEAFKSHGYGGDGVAAMKNMLDIIESYRAGRETELINETDKSEQEVPSVNLGGY